MSSTYTVKDKDLMYFPVTGVSVSLFDTINDTFSVNPVSGIVGVYTGYNDPNNANIKYFAPLGSYIYTTGYTDGEIIKNNSGKSIGVFSKDRICIYPTI